jgi:hypothetical protein
MIGFTTLPHPKPLSAARSDSTPPHCARKLTDGEGLFYALFELHYFSSTKR